MDLVQQEKEKLLCIAVNDGVKPAYNGTAREVTFIFSPLQVRSV